MHLSRSGFSTHKSKCSSPTPHLFNTVCQARDPRAWFPHFLLLPRPGAPLVLTWGRSYPQRSPPPLRSSYFIHPISLKMIPSTHKEERRINGKYNGPSGPHPPASSLSNLLFSFPFCCLFFTGVLFTFHKISPPF